MENKFAWISTPDELWDDKKEMITTALESGIDHVLDLDDIENTIELLARFLCSIDETTDLDPFH